ncbi:MAG: NUDIX domain-containing protein [Candidatus Aenigmarchaeota archaeon]|nr:NUDIX domain-containing protein [Candidatus Aenigmarchaeota archaeon]
MEIDKLALIFIKDRKMLGTFSKGKNIFYMPGGKREQGETDEQALTRELKEEISVHLLPESISYYGTFRAQADGKPEGTFVKITCYTGEFSGKIKPSSEVERIDWLTSKDVQIASPVGIMILNELKAKGLID